MASRNPQTMAKRAREQAVRERRERKRAKKAETASERAAAREARLVDSSGGADVQTPLAPNSAPPPAA